MAKLVIYQDKKWCWVITTDRWNSYCYEKELKPIKFALIDATNIWVEQLMEIFNNNKELFIDLIKAELNNVFTFSSN